MRKISDTIARLNASRGAHRTRTKPGRLSPVLGVDSNPGALRGWCYVPRGLPEGSPLVVVLHGCTQTAAGYDHGSGWSKLADDFGFALLFPEQTRPNNANLCFNWFQPNDTARGQGEVHSIAQMIETMLRSRKLDRGRVFITGLSAGGAMAAAMLATYPELFEGGAIIAGLPHGVAGSVPEAFDRMRAHGMPSARNLQQLLDAASDHDGPWPSLSLWHGERDLTVSSANMDALVDQWREVHGVSGSPSRNEKVSGHLRRVWKDPSGREVIEAYTIEGMGHGIPLDTEAGYGAAGPFLLEAGISSTLRIANFWGIADAKQAQRPAGSVMKRETAGAAEVLVSPGLASAPRTVGSAGSGRPATSSRIGRIIEGALKKAGLMP